MSKTKIALLSGGISGEREVSLKTGQMIYDALDKNKYEIFRYDSKTDIKQFIDDALDKKFDLVFPALHGPFGEDGKLQGMLDMIEMPYVFSGCLASALAMDKDKTKILAKKHDIPVANDILITKNRKINLEKILKQINLPIVIKPIASGSSVGMSIAKTEKDLETGITEAFKHDTVLLLEEYIKGRELTVAVMGNNPLKTLSVIEIKPKTSEWFDFEAKYKPGASEEICPADIPVDIKNKVQAQAILIHKTLGCKDLSRSDFIWNQTDNQLYFLEINTIPGMTETSLVPQAAKVDGLNFNEFLDELIKYNLTK